MSYSIIRDGEEKHFDDENKFNDMCSLLDERGTDYETETPDTQTDGGEAKTVEPVETERKESPELIGNPIDYLRGINSEFVNTIKGTPAISKRGFRYMQTELGISTQAEVVETLEDPVGVIVWARAGMPNGRTAEAHGEGYLTESGVDDNEWVRYADSRAKNRAISDLTAAGALSEAEL